MSTRVPVRRIMVIILALVPVLWLTFVCVEMFLLHPMRLRNAEKRIRSADLATVRKDCLELLLHRDALSNFHDVSTSPPKFFVLGSSTKGRVDHLPKSIRLLAPEYVFIGTNHVVLELYGPPRTGIIVFGAGAEPYGSTQLLERVWKMPP
ncbi:MAG: hypothetical protein KJ579_12335 [Verrucomicrobia bacterium]|nr:hypothetical protein [Verrucomicrobiota bacterium]